ncbi:hypothetical protein [Gynuella sunshinyii]|uniref:ATP-utilizing enzyme of the PP-loop superfamily n=1 Tax=Gynuella sunshinyii YC6258 TaxID=1445510 RepID=A0A0C5VT97_9GAMM|nr:hypothetical protein [Gynuella sunshinyii]AJQ96548.1 ATP-utilizing enzyme of the PP-loop superfamily [Gynuella sunshinyii YC6258]
MTAAIQRCTQCILSANFPKIKFDEQGVCNYCRKEDKDSYQNDQFIAEARQRIETLFSERPRNSEYDAIVCYSGGKDSTYTLQLAVEKYGLKVLAFTLDNGFISRVAFKNINKVVDALNVDHWVFRPGRNNFNAITRASITQAVYPKHSLARISAGCNSCISIVNTTALKLALEKNIPFILAGFTLGQIPINGIIYKNHYQFLAESRQQSTDKLRQAAGSSVDEYLGLSESLLQRTDNYPHNVNILCVEDLNEQQIKDAIAPLGWVAPKDVDGCSSNCRLNTFNNYAHESIFGFNPYEMELSHLIRKGLMTRSEALDKIAERPEGQIIPLMNELSITEDDLLQAREKYADK